MKAAPVLLSLFSGAGGLDLGFEQADFQIGLAFDIRSDSIKSYNHNRPSKVGYVRDVKSLDLTALDELHGGVFQPEGVIGGPPCQSFSRANSSQSEDDPRHLLPLQYGRLLSELNERHPVKFFVLENVTALRSPKHVHRFDEMVSALADSGFSVTTCTLNAHSYGTPQKRERLFVVGFNISAFGKKVWQPPLPTSRPSDDLTVKGAIGRLPTATYYSAGLESGTIAYHPNHWCMVPRSPKFSKEGALREGDGRNRSFKTLSWSRPSLTVAYGHREVHIHPSGARRLTVYEAMLLQGFPRDYELIGSLSSQIDQVSEAVPPPMARAVAESIATALEHTPDGTPCLPGEQLDLLPLKSR